MKKYLIFIFILSIPLIVLVITSLLRLVVSNSMKKYMPLSSNETENKIMDWAHNHADKLQLIEKKRVKLHTNGYLNDFLEINIIPKSSRALPVSFAIGGLLELCIQFGDHYHITYGDYNIDALELDTILKSYLLGDYFAIHWMFDDSAFAQLYVV